MISINRQNIKIFLSLLFVISGIAGLIYKIVWFKYLSLFLGSTTYAQMTVLATFLGGLALGNYYFGKKSDAIKNPVRVYSFLELIIGLYCFLYPAISSLLGNAFLSSAAELNISPTSFLFSLIRFLIAAVLLFLPTIAMGGTLPLLSNFFVEKLQDARKEIATLYFLNSFGAVVGVVFAGFILIKEFGLDITIYATASINILVGLLGFLLSLKKYPNPEKIEQSKESSEEFLSEPDKKIIKAVLAVACISGFAALLYEMVWVRLLINFFGSSTYAFSLMLTAFIGGITIGSFVVSSAFFKKFNYINLLSFLQCAIAVSTMIVLLFYDRLPYYLWKVSALFSRSAATFEIFLFVELIICFSSILLPTFFMGMSLPVASEIVSASNKKVGASVGNVFSLNTLGTVLGVIITGLIFIPFAGIKTTFEIGIGINLFAMILLVGFNKKINLIKRISIVVFFAIVFSGYLISAPAWNKAIILSGAFRSFGFSPPKSFKEFSKNLDGEKVIFYEEGINATVAVTQSEKRAEQKRLIINGKPDASSFYDMPTQVLIGQIPMMLHPNPKNIFLVGLGSGATAGSVLVHPDAKITCAEIAKEVINSAEHFKNENRDCVNNPRMKIYNEDALTLLKLSNEKYDVIISEPSNPWIAGIGNLFSKEYFKICSDKLSDNGLMVQWFHVYEADDSVVKLVLNTFSSVFPYAQLWNSVANDIILVGSKTKIDLPHNQLTKKFYSPKVKADFERIGINSPFEFLFCQSVSYKGFFTMAEDFPINSEKHPLLEFWAPKSFYVGQPSKFVYSFDEKFDTLSSGLYIKDFVKNNPPKKLELINTIKYCLDKSKNYRAAFGLSKFLKDADENDYQINLLHSYAIENLVINNPRQPILEKLVKRFPDSVQIKKDYSNALLKEKINATTFLRVYSIKSEAESFIKTTKPDSASMLSVYIQLAKAYLQNSEYDKVEEMIGLVENYLRNSPRLITGLAADDYLYAGAMVNLHKKDYEKVIGYYFALVNTNLNYENLFRLRRGVAWNLKNK